MSIAAERPAKPAPAPFSTGLGYVLRHTHKAMSRRFAAELARHDISFAHYYYLRALFEEDGLSQIELSERVGVDPTTVVTIVDALVRQKIVERRKDPDDRRKALIYLTAKGKALRRPLRSAIRAAQADALRGVSEADAAVFFRVANRVRDNLTSD